MKKSGFSLIELSVVLVIIALIVGGAIVGKNLIEVASLRGQVSQIEKYKSAVNAFRLRYSCLPGDCNNPAPFGGVARGANAGEGDGDGNIEGVYGSAPGANGGNQMAMGEMPTFWVDLTSANMIDGSFTTASEFAWPSLPIVPPALDAWLPKAAIGQGNYMYVFSATYASGGGKQSGINYFGLSAANTIGGLPCIGCMGSAPGLTVWQAYYLDNKMDDGLPQSGAVQTTMLNQGIYWAQPNYFTPNIPTTAATAGTSTTCFDNGNVASAQVVYSTAQSSNAGKLNCALSFQFD